ncbi:MAG TPA: CRISPR-associated endoribonuclease Cas6 [Anaerolineales bacterium]|nr:CRISPR-associated endoribonuclease Cas6 [Anaerolineales bacterium]
MLLAAIITLTATKPSPILGALGRPAQAWFLNQIMQNRPQLATALHDENGVKPYTVSTLLDRYGHPHKAGDWLKEGQECWLRITTIGEELSEAFLINVLKRLQKNITLHKMDFRIDGYTINPRENAWAGQTAFSEIAQDSKYIEVSRDVRMEFVTPTAFRTNGNDISIPAPHQIFRSLWQKWNATCPESMQLDDLWPNFAADCILVNELTAVNTTRWEFAQGTRGAATGFTGTVGFSLLPISKIKEQWRPFWDGADVVMQSLARFAFYAGVGHHTTIGMGQSQALGQRAITTKKPARKR